MVGNMCSAILRTMKLEPQFLHSYRSPSTRPGVSQVMLQVEHVVNGRLELRLTGIDFSLCIGASMLGKNG